MSIAGLAVEYLFRALSMPGPARPTMVVHTGFQWNYTTVLNIIALLAFAALYWLYRHRDTTGPQRYAKDAMCGMQVEIAHAPAPRTVDGDTVYFCPTTALTASTPLATAPPPRRRPKWYPPRRPSTRSAG